MRNLRKLRHELAPSFMPGSIGDRIGTQAVWFQNDALRDCVLLPIMLCRELDGVEVRQVDGARKRGR
jgi:hypothetical protein